MITNSYLEKFLRVLLETTTYPIILLPTAVNVRGSFLMTKYSLVEMKKHNYGRILLIASIAGKEVGLGRGGAGRRWD